MVIGLLSLASLRVAGASPPDAWSMEASLGSDALAERQRFDKLQKQPFDKKHWRALEKSLGKARLAKTIRSALRATPRSLNLGILSGRATMAARDFRAAATIFSELLPRSGRQESRLFWLYVEALEAAKSWDRAINVLKERGRSLLPEESLRSLNRAYTIASRNGLHRDALEISQAIAATDPKSEKYNLQVARSAHAAGHLQTADRAFGTAAENAQGEKKIRILHEQAQAHLDVGDAQFAEKILWRLLRDPAVGREHTRQSWWNDLVKAHQHRVTSDVLADRLERWLRTVANSHESAAWKSLARSLANSGRDSEQAWREALLRSPRDPSLRPALITALETRGDIAATIVAFKASKKLSPANIQQGVDIASRLIVNGAPDSAAQIIQHIRTSAGRSPEALGTLLDFYNAQGQPHRALAVAKKIVASQKRDPDACIALGEQLFELGMRTKALKEWARIPSLVRPRHLGWARHAQVLSAHARIDRSLQTTVLAALSKALDLSPNNPNYLRLRATLEEDRRTYGRAYATWELAYHHATTPLHSRVREEARTRMIELLAGAHLKNRSQLRDRVLRAAIQDLDAGASPQARESGFFLAQFYTREDRTGLAVEVRKTLTLLYPNDGDLLMDLAGAQRRAARLSDAMDTLERVLEVDPQLRSKALMLLSELAFERGQFNRAELVASLAASDPAQAHGQSSALLALGKRYEARGNLARARSAYNSLLKINPGDTGALVSLAELQLTSGDLPDAASQFQAILKTNGPADLMLRAEHGALALAEVTNSLEDLLSIAIARTKRTTHPVDAWVLLLATLDRISPAQIEHWLSRSESEQDPSRATDLRRPLVAALSRGPIHIRSDAARHLGSLRLSDTAAALMRLGGKLAAPGDATTTLRASYLRARVSGIKAAATLDTPESIPATLEVVGHRGLIQPAPVPEIQHVALWALAKSGHPSTLVALNHQLNTSDDLAISLACLGIATHPTANRHNTELAALRSAARRSRNATVRHACSLADASLTPDHLVASLIEQLRHSDTTIAAIAAWRLGSIDLTSIPDRGLQALFQVYLGPPGVPRDAAIASLRRLFGPGPASTKFICPPGENRWASNVERWIRDLVIPTQPFPLWRPKLTILATKRLRTALELALRRSEAGTRSEISAATLARQRCPRLGSEPLEQCLHSLLAPTHASHSLQPKRENTAFFSTRAALPDNALG